MTTPGGGLSQLFVLSTFRTSVSLAPHEIARDIDACLQRKLQEKYEATCTRFGYVRTGSLEVTKRGDGVLERQMFNGSVRFAVSCRALVARPMPGHVLWGSLKERTKAGWVVWVRDEDAPKTAAPLPPVVVVANIPNDAVDGQPAPLPAATPGMRVKFKVLRSYFCRKKYASVIGRLMDVAEPGDEKVEGQSVRPGAVPEDLDGDDEDAEPVQPRRTWASVDDDEDAAGAEEKAEGDDATAAKDSSSEASGSESDEEGSEFASGASADDDAHDADEEDD